MKGKVIGALALSIVLMTLASLLGIYLWWSLGFADSMGVSGGLYGGIAIIIILTIILLARCRRCFAIYAGICMGV